MGPGPRARNGARFEELIETLYDCVLQPEHLEPGLRTLGDAVGAVAPGLTIGRPHGSSEILGLDVPEARLDEWQVHWAVPLRDASQRNEATGTFFSSEVEHVPIWGDFIGAWAAPQGFAELLQGLTFVDGTLYGFGVFRERGSRAFDADQLALVDALLPHVARALQLRERMEGLSAVRDVATAALERLRIAFVLLDERARVLEASDAAGAIFAAGDGLDAVRGELRAADPNARASIGELLAAVASHPTHPGGALGVPRPSGRRPYELLAMRLPVGRFRRRGRPTAAVVFLVDPEDAPSLGETTLAELHGFTPAEARVAARLAARRSVPEIADDQGLRVQTVRNHLKSIYAKTETSRQGELVALLLSGLARLTPR